MVSPANTIKPWYKQYNFSSHSNHSRGFKASTLDDRDIPSWKNISASTNTADNYKNIVIDLRHVSAVKEFKNALYMTTHFPHSRSADHHRSWACPLWPAVIQRPLFFSVYWICTASSFAWSEGSRWKRPPRAPHCVDSVALPQARQHPLRRVTVLEISDPLPWSLTPVRGHRFPSPKLSLFPSLTCKPV